MSQHRYRDTIDLRTYAKGGKTRHREQATLK
jgi:hypothetical protein